MLGLAPAIQSMFALSGSLSSLGPAYVPLVHELDAPLYPSNRLYVS